MAAGEHWRSDVASGPAAREEAKSRLWVGRVALTSFRSYAAAVIEAGPEPVVLTGPNGAGKTNLLEAISLLVPGSGLRRATYDELPRIGSGGAWAVAAKVHGRAGAIDIGTGQRQASSATDPSLPPTSLAAGSPQGSRQRPGRLVRIDGETVGPAALADHVDMVWLTPAMDGLFTGPAADRRAFLDRLVLCFDPRHAARSARFERAMRQRNRALEDGGREAFLIDGLEVQMAETGVAIAAARLEAVAALAAQSNERRVRDRNAPFPWFALELEGTLESELAGAPAVEVEDRYRERLGRSRERDRAAGRTLEGPHRSDLAVTHGPKSMPARLSSTGEQKALLMGLVLAHAALIAERRHGAAPILLLDEVAAHLDDERRAALFEEILVLEAQAWMTGTEPQAFAPLAGRALFARVDAGRIIGQA